MQKTINDFALKNSISMVVGGYVSMGGTIAEAIEILNGMVKEYSDEFEKQIKELTK